MNTAQRLSHLKSIVRFIEAEAPDPSTREVRPNYFEGEEEFIVSYEHIDFACERRLAFIDTSNLDYYNGTGYSYVVVYDEVAVLNAYDVNTGEDNESLVYELNEILC